MTGLASHRLSDTARLRTLVVGLCLVLAGAVTGCAEPEGEVDVAAASAATAASAPTVPPTSPVEGQVVKLDTEGLTKVRGFVLRTDAGTEIEFAMGPLDNAVEFPPSHLAEHMATGDAVSVRFLAKGATLVVHRVEDAGAP